MVAGPFMPLPPGLFSTSTVWPRRFEASSATLRRWRSVEPPGGQGQTSVTGLVGKDCAAALAAAAMRTAPSSPESLFIRALLLGTIIATARPLEYDFPFHARRFP